MGVGKPFKNVKLTLVVICLSGGEEVKYVRSLEDPAVKRTKLQVSVVPSCQTLSGFKQIINHESLRAEIIVGLWFICKLIL